MLRMLKHECLNQLMMLMILSVGDGIDYLCKALWRQSSLCRARYGTCINTGATFVDDFDL